MSDDANDGVQGITEEDIANYLVHTPEFFERHAELLAAVQLSSPHGRRAVSLQERQSEMLRERIKGLERKIMEMIRASQENMALADRMHRWACSVLVAHAPADLGPAITEGLQREFMIPAVAMRVWGLAPEHAELPWVQPASEDARIFAASLSAPYCGVNAGFEAAGWLDEPVQSLAMVPLRLGQRQAQCFGLLVLGSPDALRYQTDMGTEFLEQVGDLASALLACLLVSDA